jgi:hypothetical protein
VAEVTLEDGSDQRLQASALELARKGSVTLELEPGHRPRSVHLDPDERYPDMDRSNDSWPAGARRATRAPSSEAAR